MIGLLKKDYFVLKSQRFFVLLGMMIGISLLVGYQNLIFGIASISFIGIFLPIITIGYDENSKSLEFLFTLPLTRKKYILEKYLIAVCSSLVLSVITGGILLLARYFMGSTNDLYSLLLQYIFLFVITSIFLSIIMPIIFKIGVERSRLVLIIVIFGSSFLGSFIFKDMALENIVFSAIMQMTFIVKIALSLFVSIIAIFISYKISVMIFTKKEI